MSKLQDAALAGDEGALGTLTRDAPEGPLSSHLGAWRGTNQLWLEPGSDAAASDGGLFVLPHAVGISWSFQEEPQKGVIQVRGGGNRVEADWQDSWHSSDPMACRGRLDDRVLDVIGSYPAGEGPDWGWRIELDMRVPDALVLRMYNITPDGEEALAVELVGKRDG